MCSQESHVCSYAGFVLIIMKQILNNYGHGISMNTYNKMSKSNFLLKIDLQNTQTLQLN